MSTHNGIPEFKVNITMPPVKPPRPEGDDYHELRDVAQKAFAKMSEEERTELHNRGLRVIYGCRRANCTAGMSDPELIALSALAQVESVKMAGDNAFLAQNGEPPAWREGCGFMPAGAKLREELVKRGVF